MPAKHMCVYRGQGPAIRPYPGIPERAELRTGQGQTGNCLPHCSSLEAGAAEGSLLCPWQGGGLHDIRREGLEQARWEKEMLP